jgi:hypothetical protein
MNNLCDLLKKLLETICQIIVPPTFVARFLFIFCSCIIYGMSFFYDLSFIDNYLTPKNKLKICSCKINEIIIFFGIYTLELINQDLKSEYLNTFLLDNKLNPLLLLKYQKILDEIQKYYNYRNNDGWINSNEDIELENQPYKIDPNTIIDISKIKNPLYWCPLVNQKMIGSKWNNVWGLISQNNFNIFEKELDDKFATINIENEIQEVLNTSLNLTDEQKCIAEYWAGIQGTVTPPGFWNMYILCCYKNIYSDNYLKQIQQLYQLNCGLFQMSLITWNIKYKYKQARPIQTIRLLYPNKKFDYYFGKSTGELWLPYQTSKLRTPPFPDYISGHSSFSSVGSYFMTKFFGNNIPSNINIEGNELKLLSILFQNQQQSQQLNNIIIEPHCSQIEPTVPKKTINLKFKTWQELAESAAISRLYGGIHYPSSNIIGLEIGQKVAELIDQQFSKI